MLTELSIKDFAIIEEVTITFNDGLTVLTGETGAGKSIIIDALVLLAGGRGSVEFVRHDAKKAEIEGLFTLDNQKHPVYQIGSTYGIDIQDEMIVLKRTITAGGKSICRVNGKLVTLAILREFGKTLIDIHSQHESQTLMDPESHLDLLDRYTEKIVNAYKDYTHLYKQYSSLLNKYKTLSENEQESAHRLDLLEFQKQELEQANLRPNEDVDLEKERSHLANYEKIYVEVERTYNALYGEQKGLDWLNIAQVALQEVKEFDLELSDYAEKLTGYYFQIEELTFAMRDFKETLHFDAERLNEIELRLHEIDRLKKKYGATVNDMLTYQAKIEEELDQLQHKDSHLDALTKQINGMVEDLWLEAEHLHQLRKKAAKALESQIHQQLAELYLEDATFSIALQYGPKGTETIEDKKALLHPKGFDHVKFLISTNRGEPLKEMQKIVSGGELSRIMLVIKRIFAKQQGVTSVIFDEVDTGVSGRVAQAMGEKIYEIANDTQVLCITHLPQVAAMADTHKLISKSEISGRTYTTVKELNKSNIVKEISRMMTGTKLTDTALNHGQKLLDLAATFKSKLV